MRRRMLMKFLLKHVFTSVVWSAKKIMIISCLVPEISQFPQKFHFFNAIRAKMVPEGFLLKKFKFCTKNQQRKLCSLSKICLIQVVGNIIGCLQSNFEGWTTLGLCYKNHNIFCFLKRDRARKSKSKKNRQFAAESFQMVPRG